jgi:hypothetical protein
VDTLERSAARLLSRGSTITSPLLAQCRCPSAVDTHARYVEAFNSGSVETVLSLYEPGAAFVARPDQLLTAMAPSGSPSGSSSVSER